MPATFIEELQRFSQGIDEHNTYLSADEDTDVTLNGITKPSASKALKIMTLDLIDYLNRIKEVTKYNLPVKTWVAGDPVTDLMQIHRHNGELYIPRDPITIADANIFDANEWLVVLDVTNATALCNQLRDQALASQQAALASQIASAASELAASISESNANTSESNALASENAAEVSELAALASENAAANSETAAATSESNSATSESNAATSETNANTSETNAANSASAAATSESNASTSESNAATSETNASNSALAASTSETNAATSETNASNSALAASTSETNASTSESNAATSETNASNSASAAATSESNASTSESNAATSASAAATSESNASTSESNAATSASAAATSESNAANSALEASNDETSVTTMYNSIITAFNNWDGQYMGEFTTANAPATWPSNHPTRPNDPVAGGDLYYDLDKVAMQVYKGNNWGSVAENVQNAMLRSENLGDLINVATARNNLGLHAVAASGDYNDLENKYVERTPAELLAAIKTVDGAGSGLDANLVDGQSATANNTPSTLPKRDGNGDIITRYFRSEGPTTASAADGVMVTVNSTNHAKRQTFSQFATAVKSNIGVGDGGLSEKNLTTALFNKLVGIEDNATSDQTPAELLTAIKTVDVNGTAGLNAGTLAGLLPSSGNQSSATAVVRSSAGHIYGNYGIFKRVSSQEGVTQTTEPTNIMIQGSSDEYIRHQPWTNFITNTKSGIGIGDGKLTEKNFTLALHTKLNDLKKSELLVKDTATGHLTSSSDLNSITSQGLYTWEVSLPSNAPITHGSMISMNNGQPVQMVFGGSTKGEEALYIRRRSSGTWGAWSEMRNFANTVDKTPAELLASLKTVDENGTAGLNAGTLSGLLPSGGANSTGSTVVVRDSSADIHARLFRSEYDITNSNIGYIMTQIDTASNNYMRPSTPAQLVTGLGLRYKESFNPIAARYNTTLNTGRIKITLPWNANAAKMLSFTIHQYGAYHQHTYRVSGYLYPTSNNWYVPRAVYSGTGTPDIEMGRDADGKAYVSIPTHQYSGVSVGDITIGYTGTEADNYTEGWTITREDAVLPNQVTVAVTKLWSNLNDGVGSGLDADRLQGATVSESAVQSSIVKRTAANHVYAGHFNTNIGDTPNAPTDVFINYGNNGFIYKQPVANFTTHMKTNIGIGDGKLTEKNFTSALNTKLNGIETGATADQTSAQLLASLKTVDVNGTAGLNAGTLAGVLPSSSAGNSTIVQRASNGYIYGNYINMTGSGSNSGGSTMGGMFCGTNGTDTFLRTYTPAAAREALGMSDTPVRFTYHQMNPPINAINLWSSSSANAKTITLPAVTASDDLKTIKIIIGDMGTATTAAVYTNGKTLNGQADGMIRLNGVSSVEFMYDNSAGNWISMTTT